MTATVNQRPRRAPFAGKRLGRIYGFKTLEVDDAGAITDGDIEVGYVGQTVQKLAARDAQHRGRAPGPNGEPPECQPFSDIIVGPIYLIEEGEWTQAEIDAREKYWIHALRPRYNWEHNLGSPTRIPIFKARGQRAARDRAKGLEPPIWRPDVKPAIATGNVWPVVQAVLGHQVMWWLFGAVTLFAALWRGLLAGNPHGAVWSALLTVATVAVVVWKTRPKRRRSRRRR